VIKNERPSKDTNLKFENNNPVNSLLFIREAMLK